MHCDNPKDSKDKSPPRLVGGKKKIKIPFLMVNVYLDARGLTTKNEVRNLGVSLESGLSFSSQVKAITKSAYYHLKNIATIRLRETCKCFYHQQGGLL